MKVLMRALSKETLEDIKKKMIDQIANPDTEEAHKEADALLCDLLNELALAEIVELYQKVGKWYA